MLDINNLKISDLDNVLYPIEDKHLSDLKEKWYSDPQQPVQHNHFVDKASAWFKST